MASASEKPRLVRGFDYTKGDGILCTMKPEEQEEARRYNISPEKFKKQFEERKPGATASFDIIDLLIRFRIAHTVAQAQFLLSCAVMIMAGIMYYLWFGLP